MSYVDDSDTHEDEIDDLLEDIDSDLEPVEDYDPLEASLMVGAQFQHLVNIFKSSPSAFPPIRRTPYQKSTYTGLDWTSCNFTTYVHAGKFYVMDSGYANIPGFMTPYRGERYHLPEWLWSNQFPDNARKMFDRRHATVCNVIECNFGLLKGSFPS
ncbi:Unknown protein [Striga hermonthica]|uniref:DDE Tnp4 domain-containing protein n=1 Tax=Striga hermonthica TaxID=68872 RepID=A0A9N7NUM4_STRHE|nr:Unknown protein [Striga hermonthica]